MLSVEHVGNRIDPKRKPATGLIAHVRQWLRLRAIRRTSTQAREILDQIMPARPLVAKHQRSAALHIQLASEIGWTAPGSWRGKSVQFARRRSGELTPSRKVPR